LRVIENRNLIRIFEPKRVEVIENGIRLHTEELYDLYLPNIIQATESRRKRWTEHVARTGERKGACRVLLG
jgi:hypothetical protein